MGTRPSPSQTSQTIVRIICPNGVRVTACSCPAPPQRSHVSIGVPGSAPLPWQCSQRSTASKATLTLAPCAASIRSISTAHRDVAALRRPGAPPAPRRRTR